MATDTQIGQSCATFVVIPNNASQNLLAHPRDGQSLLDTAPSAMAFARSSSKVIDGIELVMWPNDEMIAAMGISDPGDVAILRARMDASSMEVI